MVSKCLTIVAVGAPVGFGLRTKRMDNSTSNNNSKNHSRKRSNNIPIFGSPTSGHRRLPKSAPVSPDLAPRTLGVSISPDLPTRTLGVTGSIDVPSQYGSPFENRRKLATGSHDGPLTSRY